MKNKIVKTIITFVTLIVLVATQVYAIVGTLLVGGTVVIISGLFALNVQRDTREMQVKPEATQQEIEALGHIMTLYDEFLSADGNNKKMRDLASECTAQDAANARSMINLVLLTLDNSGYKSSDLRNQAGTTNISQVMEKLILTKKFLNGLEDSINGTNQAGRDEYRT